MQRPPDRDLYTEFAESLGTTGTAILDVLLQSGPLQWILLEIARAWQQPNISAAHIYFDMPASLQLRLTLTIVFLAGWIYLFVRWFRRIGWPRFWALPFVLLILCPMAWVSARFPPGIDWLLLLLPQSPIMVLFVLRVRSRARQRRNFGATDSAN